MKIVDPNVLIYAVNQESEEHEAARHWLDSALTGGARVGFAWVALLAFVRLTTKPGLFPRPLAPGQAMAQVEDWLAAPGAQIVAPTARHPQILAELIEHVGTGGNLVTDAHLAALAREHRAEIVSYDRDFERFPGVTCQRPGR
ncbi:MAG: type II toxin-antitoxin system VapC family toxin [Kineosporiaceae bacterium]